MATRSSTTEPTTTTTVPTVQPGVVYRFSFRDFAIGEEDDAVEPEIDEGRIMFDVIASRKFLRIIRYYEAN